MNNFEIVSDHLKKLGNLYLQNNDTIRAGTFFNAIRTLTENVPADSFPNEIRLLPKMKGIGNSVLTEIDQVLRTGTSDRLKLLEVNQKQNNISEETNEKVNRLKSLLKRT